MVREINSKGQVLGVKIGMAITTVRNMVISLLNVLTFKKTKEKMRASRRTTSEESSRRVSWQHGKNLKMKEKMKKSILL